MMDLFKLTFFTFAGEVDTVHRVRLVEAADGVRVFSKEPSDPEDRVTLFEDERGRWRTLMGREVGVVAL